MAAFGTVVGYLPLSFQEQTISVDDCKSTIWDSLLRY
jgi:hypothetical protein